MRTKDTKSAVRSWDSRSQDRSGQAHSGQASGSLCTQNPALQSSCDHGTPLAIGAAAMTNHARADQMNTEQPTPMDVPRKPAPRVNRSLALGALAAVAITAISIALSQLKAAAPAVDRTTIWIDTVKRGAMLRQVQGPGLLVPEQLQWVSAVSAARVERIMVRPGSRVDENTILLQLSNPDLELRSLEAERQLASAEAELTTLLAGQRNQRLAQESAVATLRSELRDAKRRAAADEELARRGFLSQLEMSQTSGKAQELQGRLEFEQMRLSALSDGMLAQASAQKAQIARLRSIADFRRKELEALRIPSGFVGVLQELPLQVGQWVAPGTLLAKIVQPERLKAEVRIAEVQAKDIQIGQLASIDTRNGVVAGQVVRVDPAVHGGTVKVDIAIDAALPKGARPDLSVEGIIELERLDDVLFVGRPAFAQSDSRVGMFKLEGDGEYAIRTPVYFGRSSARTAEIKSGLREGDQVILSDMSRWDSNERIRLQ